MSRNERIDELCGDLHTLWLVALKTRLTRDTWREIERPLRPYAASAALHDMHRDAVLTGVRKLVEQTRGSRSMFRVLSDISRLEISVDDLMARHSPHAWLADAELRTELTRHIYALNAGVPEPADNTLVPDESLGALGERLVPQRVRKMARNLAERHQHVVAWCNEEVTHLPSTRTAEPPSWADVEAVVMDVLALAKRWLGLLDRADLQTESVTPQARDLTRALELFDWRRYVEAVSDRQAKLFDHRRQAPSFKEVERTVAIAFVWPDSE